MINLCSEDKVNGILSIYYGPFDVIAFGTK